MSWEYLYTKDLDPDILSEILVIDDALKEKFAFVRMTGLVSLGATDNVKIHFDAALDAAEKASLDVVVDTYETNDITVALLRSQQISKNNSIGFESYKKVFSLIDSQGGFTALDAGRTAYKNYLTPVRMMLKDGMPESAYREYINAVFPVGLFNATTDNIIRKWMRKLCMDLRPKDTYPTEADYEPVLTAIETAPEGSI